MVIDRDSALMIILHYGRRHQARKLMEEAYELAEAVLSGDDPAHVAEEIADCRVMLEQIKELYCISEKNIIEIANAKIDRQLKRIQNEKDRQDIRDHDSNSACRRLCFYENLQDHVSKW